MDVSTSIEGDETSDEKLKEFLQLQLSEVELLQAMYPGSKEFILDDPTIIMDMEDFIAGKYADEPPNLSFTVNLDVEKGRIELSVSLPRRYPSVLPELFVRSQQLGRWQQRDINKHLADHVRSLDSGDLSVGPAITWLQEEADGYLNQTTECASEDGPKGNSEVGQHLARYWVYSHHIYNKTKRRNLLELSRVYALSGFCLAGKPGVICVEGLEALCDEWWSQVKSWTWKRIVCKKKEVEEVKSGGSLNELRRFPDYQEISGETSGSRSGTHADLGFLLRYLRQHQSDYIFKDFFGIDGTETT